VAAELLNFFFFSSRRRHTRLQGDWSSDVCSSDLWGENIEEHCPTERLRSSLRRLPSTQARSVRQCAHRGRYNRAVGFRYLQYARSEERRVGKESRARGSVAQ